MFLSLGINNSISQLSNANQIQRSNFYISQSITLEKNPSVAPPVLSQNQVLQAFGKLNLYFPKL